MCRSSQLGGTVVRASNVSYLTRLQRIRQSGGTVPKPASPRRTTRRIAALLLVGLLVAAACSSSKSSISSGSNSVGASSSDTTKPVTGGSVTYAQEAEDAGGLCLPEAQLDISGINYARTIYDTLTMPNDKGEFVPVPRQVGRPQRGLHDVDDRPARRHQVPRRHRARRAGREEQPRRVPRRVSGDVTRSCSGWCSART